MKRNEMKWEKRKQESCTITTRKKDSCTEYLWKKLILSLLFHIFFYLQSNKTSINHAKLSKILLRTNKRTNMNTPRDMYKVWWQHWIVSFVVYVNILFASLFIIAYNILSFARSLSWCTMLLITKLCCNNIHQRRWHILFYMRWCFYFFFGGGRKIL